MSKKKKLTPLMRQYFDIKDQYPGTILLFRVGDFYETFAEDAVRISKELGITLTKRNNGSDQTPLAGFPYHALDTYLPKLVKGGARVAICEQTEDPEAAKKAGRKVVKREVTEITTPGITLSDKLLDHKRNNYITSVYWSGESAGVAFADISTGEFALSQIRASEVTALLQSIQPAEVLVRKKLKNNLPDGLDGFNITPIEEWVYEGNYGYKILTDHFRTHSLKGFGVDDLPIAHKAAGSLLHYMRETQKSSLAHLKRLHRYENSGYMSLDAATKRNLELTSPMQEGGNDGTLVSILDDSKTAMGGRLLRKWIMGPLKQAQAIDMRLEAVDWFYTRHSVRKDLREELDGIGDLERLISRISVGRCNSRDLKQLQLSLGQIPGVKELLKESGVALLDQIEERLEPLPALQARIESAIVDDPPVSIRDGGMIREGYHDGLDELREIARDGKSYITGIKNKLAAESGIPSLKIGYNKVFGYYIEVTNTHKERVPEHFIRKQTLVNSERYITPELKEVEEKVLSAEDKSKTLEGELFEELRAEVAEYAEDIQQIAQAVAELDCIQSFAEVAFRNNYVRPVITTGDTIDIKKGRHPVVERNLPAGEPFIPNDILLNNSEYQILMITGPNMAGKSIVLRQTGLLVLMAQLGSFVPAEKAEIGLVDKIFTRVGASDNLAAGESTFLVEMNEAANILNNATPKSLILLDEVGRGTSTFDGLSIAWALAEYLHNQTDVAAKTLFATHYHELNELESRYERIKNFSIQVKEHEGKVIFLRKLVRGGADHSYGIQVASMAGLPVTVIERAKEILSNLESHTLDVSYEGDNSGNGAVQSTAEKKYAAKQMSHQIATQAPLPQMTLFDHQTDPNVEILLNKLEASDPERMTPIDALILISELKKLIR